MRTEKVIVVDYDNAWPEAFQAIRSEVTRALGDLALAVEHVGSTAVVGLAAKPIIDIDVVIASVHELKPAIQKLSAIGYRFEGDLGVKDRYAFRYDGKEHLQAHHLYVCPKMSRELARHITFREYLRAHPGAAAMYGQVKREAAQLYPDDIGSYLQYKSDCISELYKKCGLE